MKTSYNITSECEDVAITKATTLASIFGIRCSIKLTSYVIRSLVTMTVEIQPDNKAISDMSAAPNGMLRIADGAGTSQRVVEQSIDVGYVGTMLLSLSELEDGGVTAGRFVANNMLRKMESMAEHIRLQVRRGLSSAFREQSLDLIDIRYGDETDQFIEQYLGQLHWALLLNKSECGTECMNVLTYTLEHNPPSYYTIVEDRELDVAPLGRLSNGFTKQTIADAKATSLLRKVCGEELAQEFETNGQITIEKNGYRFVVKPRDFVKVFDAEGRSARLCIHTISFKCNPIDELTIAYLNINHQFNEYWRLAIRQGADEGFAFPTRKVSPAA